MWEVLENGAPAILEGRSGWKNNKFDSFNGAEQYAKQWCGNLLIDRPRGHTFITKEAWAKGINITYNEYACVIKIIEIPTLDDRFTIIHPNLIESSPEPNLLTILTQWYMLQGISTPDCEEYAKQYITGWCTQETTLARSLRRS